MKRTLSLLATAVVATGGALAAAAPANAAATQYVRVQNRLGGQCIDVTGHLAILNPCGTTNVGASQQWQVVAADGFTRLKSRYSGLCLGNPRTAKQGVQLELTACGTSTGYYQQITRTAIEAPWEELKFRNNAMCADAELSTPKAPLTQDNCVGYYTEQFQFIAVPY